MLRQRTQTSIMPFNFVQEIDLLCEAFENLTIEEKYNKFTCFSKLPQELQLMVWKEAIADPVVHNATWLLNNMNQPIIPEILSGINWLSYNEARKSYKRSTYENHLPTLFFNVNYDSLLLTNFEELRSAAMLMQGHTVTSIQCSARICDTRPPLINVDRYLELEHDGIRFPCLNLKTFIIQDLQCSREHRLQDITERVLCKEALRRYFVKQYRKNPRIKIPEIIIRVPQQGNKLCYECKKLDDWLAMNYFARRYARVSIIDEQTTIPRQHS